MPVRRLAPLLTPLVAAALLVGPTACGGDDDDPSADGGGTGTTTATSSDGAGGDAATEGTGTTGDAAGSGTGAATGPGACARLTTGEVTDLFGEPATAVPGPTPATCLWEAASGSSDAPVRHQLQLSIYPGAGGLDPAAYGSGAEPLEGLGDDAFVVPEGTLGTTAGYATDDEAVVLTYAVVGGEGAADPAERADDVVDLLRTVAED